MLARQVNFRLYLEQAAARERAEPNLLDIVQVLGLRGDLAEFDLFDRRDELDVGWSGDADLRAFGGDDAVDIVDLGAAALEHVLPHRRPRELAAGVRLQRGQDLRFDLVERGSVALGGARERLGVVHADVLELIAERLADAHPLAGETNAEAPDL